MYKTEHKTPEKLSLYQKQKITELIASGGQSPKDKIIKVLDKSLLISYVKFGKEIVSTAVIKNASEDRRRLIFENTNLNHHDYTLELGFWSTSPLYRKQNLALSLIKKQIDIKKQYKLFCVVHHKNLISKLIEEFNFIPQGELMNLGWNSNKFQLLVK